METRFRIGKKINGDFDGNGQIEEIEIHLVKKGYGNYQTDDKFEFDKNEILISTNKINVKGLNFGSYPILINEGDLNENGGDELSIVSYSPNGTQVSLTVYSFNGNSWGKFLDVDNGPGTGTDLTLQDLQNRVYRKNKKTYYLNTDVAGVTAKKQLRID